MSDAQVAVSASDRPALSGRAFEDEFCSIARELGGDVHGRESGSTYLASTHARSHGEAVAWAMSPKIFDQAAVSILRDAAETMGRIMDKVTTRYLEETPEGAALRAAFALPDPLERYALVPTGYDRLIPLARVDVFFDEDTGDYQFCELNTDGSAGMTVSDEVSHAVQLSQTYREFESRHPDLPISLFDVTGACVDELLDVYATWANISCTGRKPDHPSLAIVDYAESVSADEVADFVNQFRDRGVSARFTDIHDLRMVEFRRPGPNGPRTCQVLRDDEGPIDLVWRRAVPSEVAEKPCDGVEALIEAQEAGLVCVVGGFRTWPVATKTVFSVLWSDLAADILSTDELEFVHSHVPYTVSLTPGADLAPYAEKDRWIAKPAGGYNGSGVVAGLDVDADEWSRVLASTAADGGVVQAYAHQYATPTIAGGGVPDWADPTNFAPANNMEGLYLFGGRFAGVFTRCGYTNTIGEFTSRFNMGCLVVGAE
jgi:hypothetical protein